MNNNIQCPFCASENVVISRNIKDYFLTQESFSLVNCHQCGLLFTEPFPDADDLGRYYDTENYLSHQEKDNSFVGRLYAQIKSINLRNKFEIASRGLKNGKLLDIGCGIGDFLMVAKEKGWDVAGVEPSLQAHQVAENRLQIKLESSSDSSSFSAEEFDLITMWHVLEHVPDLKFQLEILYKLLKPGGRLMIALPNFQSWDAKYYQEFWAGYDVPRHLYHFDRKSIRGLFDDTLWEHKSVYPMKWDAFYVSMLSEQYKKKRFVLLRALVNGFKSNIYARKSGEYSSLIYSFTKR